MDRAAESAPPGSHKLIFTPWLYGERAPVDDHTVRGGFFNQTLNTTRADMIRGVLEGVAYNSRWLLKYVEDFVGRRVEEIAIVGGGAKSNVWCQIHADVLGRRIKQMRDPILVNVRGAAFLGSVALGRMTFADIPSHLEVANTFEPRPENREIYDELFSEFVHIYSNNKKTYARLNRNEAQRA